MDATDYETPLKPYIDTNLDWYLSPGLQKSMHLNVQQNKFVDNNNVIGVGDGREYQFYSVNNIRDDYKIEDDTHQLLNIIVKLDDRIINYSRNAYSFLDVIADVGGYMELVKLGFYYFVSTFSAKQFMSFINKQMYFVTETSSQHKKLTNKVSNLANYSPELDSRIEYANADISINEIEVPLNCEISERLKKYILSKSRPNFSV